MNQEIQSLVEKFQLQPHPEGGYYKETYRCTESYQQLPSRFDGTRQVSTAIYYLLGQQDRSLFHRIKSDELWHFYHGGPLTIVEINPEGVLKKTLLGRSFQDGETFQHVVPAGSWFGSYPSHESFSFVGCTVAPGFDFKDFELATRKSLLTEFPQHHSEIESLTTP